ncbi:hypothetical protein J6590_035029 [Homalodisca vitripennis]|nr:hypothetical protein J6590_035029 [Homalodisca vitripennis]
MAFYLWQAQRRSVRERICIDHVYLKLSCRDRRGRPCVAEAAVVKDITDHTLVTSKLTQSSIAKHRGKY